MTRPGFRVLIAPDAFKECLDAPDVADAMAAGWLAGFPESQVHCLPMADGGEGTAAILQKALGGESVRHTVTGPLGHPVEADYVLLDGGKTAVIELATASGLALVPPEHRDLRAATTFGTGELLRHALDRGCTRIVLALGGSATNDGGAGLAQALGVGLHDRNGSPIGLGGGALADLASVDCTSLDPRLASVAIEIVCDVTNPLCGVAGASLVYGPQKGGNPKLLAELDHHLSRFGTLLEAVSARSLVNQPGVGAAGGTALPLLALTAARLRSGFDVIADATGLHAQIAQADLLLTGEGALDDQSSQGKVVSGMVAAASKAQTNVIALAGTLRPGFEGLYEKGLTAAYSIAPGPAPLDVLVLKAPQLIHEACFNIARTLRSGIYMAPARCHEEGSEDGAAGAVCG